MQKQRIVKRIRLKVAKKYNIYLRRKRGRKYRETERDKGTRKKSDKAREREREGKKWREARQIEK